MAGSVLNNTVDIRGYGLGPYNRILGVVFVDGKNVNLEMVKTGLSEVYRGKPPRGFDVGPYKKAKKEAKKKKDVVTEGEVYKPKGLAEGEKVMREGALMITLFNYSLIGG